MRKLATLFAVAGALIAALLYRGNLPGVGDEKARAAIGVEGRVAVSQNASLADPMGDRVIPMQMMMEAKDLPTEQYHDYSLVFD